jgi:hypothetical protein
MGWIFYDSSGNQAISQLGTLAILKGGTGATTASAARTSLGVAIGSDVQAYDADLAAIAGLTSAANKGIQFTGSGAASVYDLTAAGKALLDDADDAAQRVTLGLGTIAVLASPLPVANGGTNVSSYAVGDVLYASGTTTIAKLAKPGTPAGEVLTFATGATAPTWVAASAGASLGLVIALGG